MIPGREPDRLSNQDHDDGRGKKDEDRILYLQVELAPFRQADSAKGEKPRPRNKQDPSYFDSFEAPKESIRKYSSTHDPQRSSPGRTIEPGRGFNNNPAQAGFYSQV